MNLLNFEIGRPGLGTKNKKKVALGETLYWIDGSKEVSVLTIGIVINNSLDGIFVRVALCYL